MTRFAHPIFRDEIKPSDIERFERFLMPIPFCGCIIHLGEERGGYGRFLLNGKMHSAHRVAWATENGDLPSDTLVLHRCDVRCCCNPLHLFPGTNDDNIADMCRKGRQAHLKGELHGEAKLTVAKVLEIRSLDMPQRRLAAMFGVSQSKIGQIKRRISWTHV